MEINIAKGLQNLSLNRHADRYSADGSKLLTAISMESGSENRGSQNPCPEVFKTLSMVAKETLIEMDYNDVGRLRI